MAARCRSARVLAAFQSMGQVPADMGQIPVEPTSRHQQTHGKQRSPSLCLILGGERLDEVDDRAAHLRVTDAHEGPVELEAFAAVEKIDDIILAPPIGKAGRGLHAPVANGNVLVEEADAYAEQLAQLVEPAGADPIDPLLVLLDLLERKTELFGQ